MIKRTALYGWLMGLILGGITACDPLAAPLATPQTIIVTAIPSDTPPPTVTPTFTPTSTFTPTPDVTPTPTLAPCLSAGGQVQEFSENFSEVAQENLRYRVYLPPCYTESMRRFPTLYLLHGASYTEKQWQDIGTIEAMEQGLRLGVLAPFIIVMPYWGTIGN